ncbi:DUF3369 domain-containing protein [Agarivorans sp. TSD2052]|uniref:DUF3369 domain-containing protein n=1 Tax=Agarivorans sp. TSD2052 TaxID=2937286 RepID=UPI00200EDE8C|nr:DUF3369 domain-containing protein [Agarivorans sp. TSD2052]UPW17355.1 DUF3369 domain-containing protein [Agarivorans sp. TSD2052]
MSSNAELFILDDDNELDVDEPELEPWKVLIVDDDSEMHTVTKLVLNNFSYQQRKLSFIDAYNAAEAFELLSNHADVAIALVDVVMESDDAGLLLIDDIRQRLNNHQIRLILRTGQPGLAPIREVIRRYDVSDYKNKTELSDVNLDTLMCASLRAYQEISELHSQHNKLRAVINSSHQMATGENEQILAHTTLHELRKLAAETGTKPALIHGLAISSYRDRLCVLDSIGKLDYLKDTRHLKELPNRLQALISQAQQSQQHSYGDTNALFFLANPQSEPLLFYIEGWPHTTPPQFEPLEYYLQNTSVRLENRHLQKQLAYGQLQLVEMLYQSMMQAKQRPCDEQLAMQSLCEQLAPCLALTAEQIIDLKASAWFYDLANVGLPDLLLNCNILNRDIWQRIEEHCGLPEKLQDPHVQRAIDASVIIANQCREHWDGSGKPLGLAGESIHPYARITGLAAFALQHQQQPELAEKLKQASAVKFDPKLVLFALQVLGI